MEDIESRSLFTYILKEKKELKRKGKDMIIPRYGGVESLLQVCGRLESELELSGESRVD